MSMGHKKVPEKLEYTCKECGKKLDYRNIALMGKKWVSGTLRSYWVCPCGTDRVRVKDSGHTVIRGNTNA